MKLETYYLDLEKLSLKNEDERHQINRYYMDMLSYSVDRKDISMSLFYTLYNAGYLRENRDEKIEKILS